MANGQKKSANLGLYFYKWLKAGCVKSIFKSNPRTVSFKECGGAFKCFQGSAIRWHQILLKITENHSKEIGPIWINYDLRYIAHRLWFPKMWRSLIPNSFAMSPFFLPELATMLPYSLSAKRTASISFLRVSHMHKMPFLSWPVSALRNVLPTYYTRQPNGFILWL